jgi:hypothetical protein
MFGPKTVRLGHTSGPVRMHVSKAMEAPARPIEVFTGAGRSRNWLDEKKSAILADEYATVKDAIAKGMSLRTPSALSHFPSTKIEGCLSYPIQRNVDSMVQRTLLPQRTRTRSVMSSASSASPHPKFTARITGLERDRFIRKHIRRGAFGWREEIEDAANALQVCSTVLGSVLRRSVVSFEKTCSIGLRSGE